MRGLQKAVQYCSSYVCYPHQIPSVGHEIRLQGDRLTTAPISQMVIDMPFDNHFFVKCGNKYWDPTYGFSFANPDGVFCSCKNWELVHPGFGGQPSASDGIFYAKSIGYWAAQLNTPGRQKYLMQAVPGLKIDPGQYFCFFKDTKDTTSREPLKVAHRNLTDVPPALARSVFNIDGFLKPRLMKAVLAYEKNSNFLRSPSLETKTALVQIRRYADDYTIADTNVQKKYYRQKDVKGGRHIWTDQEALSFASKAIKPGNKLVGTRLQQNLAKAFQGYEFCFGADG